jgi:(2R)-ethylmalonyl-CoA mutase
MQRMQEADLSDVPVVVGGIIPPEDAEELVKIGVSRVYTPKDFDLNSIMADILLIVEETAFQAA